MADFPCGLSIPVQAAERFDVPVPARKETLNGYRSPRGEQKKFSFADWDSTSKEDFLQFYGKQHILSG